MKNLANTLVAVVGTFIVTLILQTVVSYLALSKGSVTISPAGTIQGQMYVLVNLTNFVSTPIDNIMVSVPKSTDIQGIVSSSPLQMNALPDALGLDVRKRVTLSNVEPGRVTSLLVPIRSQDESAQVQVLNDKQLGLALSPIVNIQSPLTTALSSALPNTIITAIIYGIFFFWVQATAEHHKKEVEEEKKELEKEIEKLQKSTEELDVRIENVGKEYDSLKMSIRDTDKSFNRAKILLLARLADYAKELSFWRDTMRKILYQSTHDEKAAEKVISQVTETLKTYGTREKGVDFDAITTLAKLLSEPSKDGKQLEG